jgi:Flp pilus assembly protein TadG
MTTKRLRSARARNGQSLTEFALILPILLMLVGGIIQFGVLFATQHSLIQIGRDLGRWAATQQFDPCASAATASPVQPVTRADALAQQSNLLGYAAGAWNAANDTVYDNIAMAASPPSVQGVEVMWTYTTGTDPCPPVDSTDTSWVTVRLSHRAPLLLPGLSYLPGLGTCDATGCYLAVTTTAKFRMEPVDAP